MDVLIILPARYGSSRFPGKPLAILAGKPLIQHAYEAAAKVPGADKVVVATDDGRIGDAVTAFGGQVVMTEGDHSTGSDRLAEVARKVEAALYVNIQGDEILQRPEMLTPLINAFQKDPRLLVGTLCHEITDVSDLDNPNVVKVVRDHDGFAHYFSRAPIPYRRDAGDGVQLLPDTFFRHFGLYIYRRSALLAFPDLPASPLEEIEKLEQLRFLQAGYRIKVLTTEHSAWRVDTPIDLKKVAREMRL